MKHLTWPLERSSLWVSYFRINKGLLGDNCGSQDSFLRKLQMWRDILTIWKMWLSLPTGWQNSSGKAEKNLQFLKWRMKYSSTSSSSFNIQTSRWPFTSSKKIKTIASYSVQPILTSMFQVKSSLMRSKNHMLSMKNISAASRSQCSPKKPISTFRRRNLRGWVLFQILITQFELVIKFCWKFDNNSKKIFTKKMRKKIIKYGQLYRVG